MMMTNALDRFDVVVVGFDEKRSSYRSAAHQVGALQRACQLDFETASKMLRRVPVTVRRAVPEEQAEQAFHALRAVGARVELRRRPSWVPPPPRARASTPAGLRPAAVPASIPAPRPRSSTPAGAPRSRTSTPPGVAVVEERRPGDGRGFFASIPVALLQPLRGQGRRWLMWCTGYGVFFCAALLATRFMWIFGALLMFFFTVVYMGLIAGIFRAGFWGAFSGHDDPTPMNDFDATSIFDDYVGPGLGIVFNTLLTQLALVLWAAQSPEVGSVQSIVHMPLGIALFIGPMLYWPIGLSLMAGGSALSFWDLARGLRILVLAPVEVLVTNLIGLACYVVPWVAFLILMLPLGLLPTLLAAPVMVGLPFAYSHAVQGALMGNLLRARPRLVRQAA